MDEVNMETDDVISAFLDGEPFAAADLTRALADAAGRELLVDLTALRSLVRDDDTVAPAAGGTIAAARRRGIAVGFLAASIVFAVVAAVFLPALLARAGEDLPPRPDRVVVFDTP
jgi:hypothetical protein